MTSIEPLILFTRPGCHLCELAMEMLSQANIAWDSVNIEDDPKLEDRYSLLIPVIRDPASGRELAYPFDTESVQRLLAQ